MTRWLNHVSTGLSGNVPGAPLMTASSGPDSPTALIILVVITFASESVGRTALRTLMSSGTKRQSMWKCQYGKPMIFVSSCSFPMIGHQTVFPSLASRPSATRTHGTR